MVADVVLLVVCELVRVLVCVEVTVVVGVVVRLVVCVVVGVVSPHSWSDPSAAASTRVLRRRAVSWHREASIKPDTSQYSATSTPMSIVALLFRLDS